MNNDSSFVQACEYEGSETYTFEIGDGNNEEFLDGVPYPVIGHDYDDLNYFIIEEIFVTDNGRNL